MSYIHKIKPGSKGVVNRSSKKVLEVSIVTIHISNGKGFSSESFGEVSYSWSKKEVLKFPENRLEI